MRYNTVTDDPAAPYIVARTRVLDVGSPRALALACECINECMNGHPRCSALAGAAEAALPTRLVDCSDPDHPRLVSTGGTHGTYLALSYVWGEPQPHNTTLSNLSDYADEIASTYLPQTIRDAIHVTHALGFRFLWADSLCIIQNSDEDKRREIGRMRYIYRNARLTIIASSAPRVSAGFLQDRLASDITEDGVSSDITLPFICPLRSDSSTEQLVGMVHISPKSTRSDPFGYNYLPYDPGQEPINGRGWCLQEYFMSTRALLFTSHALLFRCQTTTLSIGGAYYDTYYDRRLPDSLFHPDTRPDVVPDSKTYERVHRAWQVAIQDYTRRAVSLPSDKLVACGGLAEEFARLFRSDYLAGLWRTTLLRDLLWHNQGSLIRPAAYRAPSWSWASVDGAVIPGRPPFSGQGLADVIQAEVVLEDAALPYGQVTGALLVLHAALVSCVCRKEDEIQRFFMQPATDSSGSVRGNVIGTAATEFFGSGSIDCEEDEGATQNAWIVPLWGEEDMMEGLVVVPTDSKSNCNGPVGAKSGRKLQSYHRIGYMVMHMYGKFEGISALDWISEQPMAEFELV